MKRCITLAIAVTLAVPTRALAEDPPAAGDHEAEWAAVEAPPPPAPKSAGPPPPSPELAKLTAQGEKADRLMLAGYIVAAIGGLVLVAGIAPLAAGEIEEDKEENFFQEAGDPVAARRKKRLGAGLMLSGLGVALVGGSLIAVGLVRKKKTDREIQRVVAPTASIAPWFGGRAGGIALTARF